MFIMKQNLSLGKNLEVKGPVKEQAQTISGPVCPISPGRRVRGDKGSAFYKGGALTSSILSVVL